MKFVGLLLGFGLGIGVTGVAYDIPNSSWLLGVGFVAIALALIADCTLS